MQAPNQVPFIRESELVSPSDHSSIPDNCVRLPDDLLVQRGDLEHYLAGALSVRRLNAIHDWLWRAGLPGRVQALHHQKVLRRHILVTERMDLHLVWCVILFIVVSCMACAGQVRAAPVFLKHLTGIRA